MNLDLANDRDRAQAVPCPPPPHGCAAPAGDPCVRIADGTPLEHLPAHTARIKAAGIVHAPIDSRELRADPNRGGRR